MFWVTKWNSGKSRSNSARAVCAGFGLAAATSVRRYADQFWISPERSRRGEFLRIELRPQPGLRIPKGRHPAFGRHTCAGERDHSPGALQSVHQFCRNSHTCSLSSAPHGKQTFLVPAVRIRSPLPRSRFFGFASHHPADWRTRSAAPLRKSGIRHLKSGIPRRCVSSHHR